MKRAMLTHMSAIYNEKLKNLILYVLSHPDYREGGIKKLNKLLYFIDFYYYRDHAQLISGADYAKADLGPVIDRYREIFLALEQDGVLASVGDAEQITYKPLMAADLGRLTSEEVDHVGKVLDRYGKLSGSDLELISHQQQPWLLTENMGERIDPDLALLISHDDAEAAEMDDPVLKDELIRLANST